MLNRLTIQIQPLGKSVLSKQKQLIEYYLRLIVSRLRNNYSYLTKLKHHYSWQTQKLF